MKGKDRQTMEWIQAVETKRAGQLNAMGAPRLDPGPGKLKVFCSKEQFGTMGKI